jgi:hypothetical protein
MRPVDGTLSPANEVDDARWVPCSAASRLLSYDRDRRLLAAFDPHASNSHW